VFVLRCLARLRSFRVGRIRIIYRESQDAIDIVAVGPRKSIYEETLRLVRRERRAAAERTARSASARRSNAPVGCRPRR